MPADASTTGQPGGRRWHGGAHGRAAVAVAAARRGAADRHRTSRPPCAASPDGWAHLSLSAGGRRLLAIGGAGARASLLGGGARHRRLPTATQQELCLTRGPWRLRRFLHRGDQRAAALAVGPHRGRPTGVGSVRAVRRARCPSRSRRVHPWRPRADGRGSVGDVCRPCSSAAASSWWASWRSAAILGGGRSPGVAVVSPSPAPSVAAGRRAPVATPVPRPRPAVAGRPRRLP